MDSKEAAEYLGIPIIKQSRDWWIGRCPFTGFHKRGDKKPSFGITKRVDATEASYHCFACGNKGTIRQLIYALYGGGDTYASHVKAIGFENTFIKGSAFKEQFNTAEVVIQKFNYEKESKRYGELPDKAIDYLVKRGINELAINKLMLQFDYSDNRVLFPIIDRYGDFYGFSGRSILSKDQEPVYVKDYLGLQKKYLLAGQHIYDSKLPVLVCEGLTGLASLVSNGLDEYYNCVALLGAGFTQEKADLLLKYNHNVFLLLDNDKAGFEGTKRYYDELKKFIPVYRYNWKSTNKKDIDDLQIQDIKLSNFYK
jgi:DNA primase